MINIAILIEELIGSKWRKLCDFLFKEMDVDSAYILHHYENGTVDEDKLLILIKKSIIHRKIQWFLPDIIALIDESSITDMIFERCMKYPGRFKKTLWILLGHKWLKQKQLEKLNAVLETPEAFYKLLILHLNDNSYTVTSLKKFINRNEKFLDDITNYKDHLIDQNINQEKILILDQVIKNRQSSISNR